MLCSLPAQLSIFVCDLQAELNLVNRVLTSHYVAGIDKLYVFYLFVQKYAALVSTFPFGCNPACNSQRINLLVGSY